MAIYNTPFKPKEEEQSKYFHGLTKSEENQIFSQIDSLPISQYEKNLKADRMYKEMLDKKKHSDFIAQRTEAQTEISNRAADSRDPVQAKQLKSQGKFGQLADMVRNYMYEKEGMNLDNYQDEDIVKAFLMDNPDMASQFDSFMNGEQSAEAFATRNGFDYNEIDKAVDQVFGAGGTTAAYMNQQSEGEWNDNLLGRLDTESLDNGASVKGFLKNFAKSGWNVIADVGNMVLNPLDTANSLAKTAVGAGMNALGLDDKLESDEGWLAEANQVADGLGDFLKERYGSKENILNTLYSDPVGVVSDIASVVTGGAGAVKGVATGIAKGAAKAGLKAAANTASKVSSKAGRIMNIANTADPYTLATIPYSKGGDLVLKSGKYIGEGLKNVGEKLNIDNFVGLDKATKKAIQDNPYMAQVWEQAQNYIEENGLPQKPQEVSKALMEGVKEEIQGAFKEIRSKLGEMGPEYNKLKNSGAKVSFYDINNKITDILENAGVQISNKGVLDFSKTAISPTEASAIRRIYNWAKDTDVMDISEYMRYRKAIDQLNLWEDAKGTPGKNVLKQIREAGNEVAHEQVAPLMALDKEFSEKSAALDRLSEGLVYREKRKAGQLKDNINQILKNLDEPAKRQLSNRLQEFMPGIEQKVSAINKLPDMIKAYNQVDHAEQIMKAVLGTAVAGGIGGGAIGAGAGAVLGYLLRKGYSKVKKDRWNKALNNMSDIGKEKLAEIEKKLQAKEELSKFEESYIKSIGKEIENGTFNENQVSSKTATNQQVFDEIGNYIADITENTTEGDIKLIESVLEESKKELSEQDYKLLKQVLEDQKSDWEIAKGEKEFMEGEGKRIINNEDSKAVKDFQSRILKIENEEKNVGKVAGKKVNREYADTQQRNVEAKRERLIEEIGEYYGLDQFEAAAKYDELLERANVNKVKYQVAEETPTKDSSGKSLSKGQQEYFKGSKAVDENGNLLKLYHGTSAGDFTIFQQGKNGLSNSLAKIGYWFSPDKEGAKSFAQKSNRGNQNARVEEVYLDIKNPKIYEPSEINLLDNKAREKKINEQWDLYKKKDNEANGKDYTKASGFFDDEYDHSYYERQIFQNLKRRYESDIQYEGKLGKYDSEEFRGLAEEWNKNQDANLDYDKIVKDFEEYKKLREEAQKEYTKYQDMAYSDPYEDFQYDIYKVDSNLDNKRTKKDLNMALNDYNSPNKYVEKLKSEGYDGIIIKGTEYDGDVFGGRNDQYVVFDSNQIKRTNNLNPTKNEDIRFQKYGTAGAGERGVTAAEGLNIRNFKNGKSVQELADSYGIKTNIVDSISTPTGQKAYGMYGDRVITLAKDLKESTVPHELLHATFDMVDQGKKNQILDGLKQRLKVDDVQAEEWLADNFSEYYRTGKFDTKAIPTTFVGQIKQFFQQIKEFIDGTYANRKEIQNLFDDIIDGKLEGEYGAYSDPKFQSVWHGSRALFDKFDSSHMGEGEGGQAHGWGHYVTKNKDIATGYAKLGSSGKFMGELIDTFFDTDEGKTYNNLEKAAIYKVGEYLGYGYEPKEALKRAKTEIKTWKKEDKESWKYKYADSYLNVLDNLDSDDFGSDRNLYNVEIPDPIKKDTPTGTNYIEEDGKISYQQIEKIAEGLEKYDERGNWGKNRFLEGIVRDLEDASGGWDDKLNKYVTKGNISGRNLYKHLENYFNSDKQASKYLESLGYDGIHYLGGRDGECYVIFNDDSLNINNRENL